MSDTQIIKKFILENYMFTSDPNELDDNESFLKRGLIDSTSVLEIIMFLEDEYHIKVDDDEMIAENLDSVNNIVNFINRKQAKN